MFAFPTAAGGSALFAADPPGSFTLPVIGEAADFVAIDALSEKRLRLSDLAGRVVVLSFFYTRCNDGNACPLATQVLGTAQRLIGEHGLAGRVRFLSVTFDESHDTPAALRAHREALRAPDSWTFATPESAERRADILRAYDQRIVRAADGSITHPLRVYLIDSQRRIRHIYSQSFLRADVLASDVETLLLEGSAR